MKHLIVLGTLALLVVAVAGQKGRSKPPTFAVPSPARRPIAPAPAPVVQIKEDENEAALLANQRQRQRPQPPPVIASQRRPQPPAPVARPSAPAARPVAPRPAAAAPIRPRPSPVAPSRPSGGEEGHPAPEPYSFSFNVNDQESGAQLAREETQDAAGNIVGFYTILDAEGRQRRVEYTAGPDGFQANIQSNEEGLANKNSADALYNVQEVPEDRQNAAAAKAQQAAAAYRQG